MGLGTALEELLVRAVDGPKPDEIERLPDDWEVSDEDELPPFVSFRRTRETKPKPENRMYK